MAIAEYDVVIHRDAMSVYDFLLDARNLPSWRDGVRGVELVSGATGAKGAVYRQSLAAPAGRTECCDVEITEARPGAEIRFTVLAGPERTRGGYYLSTEGTSTRVRFALEGEARGLLARLSSRFRRRMRAEVGQLDQLKAVLEQEPEL
ncbi:putative membrane protein [Arthrobacter sp. UYCu512]|uniref:SRPBCC family protein n=1 Tax=Arthrobacter sp. UYCu512 TaxID=3156338 RepID=UPI003394206A